MDPKKNPTNKINYIQLPSKAILDVQKPRLKPSQNFGLAGCSGTGNCYGGFLIPVRLLKLTVSIES